MSTETRPCRHCGEGFTWDERYPHRAYCSRPCQRKASRTKLDPAELTCLDCGQPFDREGGRGPVPTRCRPCQRSRRRDADHPGVDRSPRPCLDCGVTVESGARGKVRARCADCAKARQRQQMDAWVDARPQYRRDKWHAHKRRRDARKRAIPSERVIRSAVYERDGWVCQLCHEPVDPALAYPDPRSASLDHRTRLEDGGHHLVDNVQLAHLHCNTVVKH